MALRNGVPSPSRFAVTSVDADVKKSAETVLDELGMNMSTAVNMFLRAVIREEGIPFKVSLKKPEEDNEI